MGQQNLTRLNVALTMTTAAFSRSAQSAIATASAMGARMQSAILGPVGLITGALSGGALVAGIKAAGDRLSLIHI